ncbi:MAG: carbamoyltransferase HypF, partial [Halobacteriota archaeon]|nr:carbamoyltransferase HypF [Halobacteriota archaeon]
MKISVKGIVQGVGFRPTVYRVAKSLGINGYVLNKGSNVEIFVDKKVEEFLRELKKEITGNASIDEIELTEEDGDYEDFVILESTNGAKSSLLPPDTATCDNCLSEIFDSKNRRHLYAFTNCTYCGARFSLIKDVPYDRDKTSMDDFLMCSKCLEEYKDPSNVRFHAQTTSCRDCGPKYTLYDNKRREVEGDPIKIFAKYIDDGSIGIMKSWGGMHLICNLYEIERFRKWYGREAKPFAVMFRNIDVVKDYMDVTEAEEREISSTRRPIVLVTKKKEKLDVLDGISPGLGNAGVYIPYTGLHHIFFKYLREDAVIMTSANIPGEPMIITDKDAFSLNADFCLLHNRDIINRIDDTVIRLYNDRRFFLRRSRGFVPDKISINHDKTVIGVGAEENVNSAISIGGNVYITQYIGNTKYYPTTEFLRSATEHLLGLLGARKVEGIGADLHPRYLTKRYGRELAERFGVEIIEVQHHFAH